MLAFASLVLLQLASEVEFLFNKQIVFGTAFVCLAIALEKIPIKMLAHPAFLFIGKISFSLYLVHFAVIHALLHFQLLDVFENGLINFTYNFFIVAFFSIPIAGFCFKFIELPSQKLGKKFIDSLESPNKINSINKV